MNPRRSTAVLRGLTSLAVTAVLLVGVPIALATLVGWPLPTAVPDGDALTRAINTGITDEFVINALAVIAWIAWAQLALAFLAEAVAAFKGRQPRDLPIAPGLQATAARLVAGILMLAAPLQPARAVAAPAEPVPAVAVAEPAAPILDHHAPTHSTRAQPVAEAARPSAGQRLERSPSNGTTPTGPSPNES